MREPLPLATIHDAVLEFLRGRDDAVLYRCPGGQCLCRGTADDPGRGHRLDRRVELAEELRKYLNQTLHIAVGFARSEKEWVIAFIRCAKPENRHLVDMRPVDELPPAQASQTRYSW